MEFKLKVASVQKEPSTSGGAVMVMVVVVVVVSHALLRLLTCA